MRDLNASKLANLVAVIIFLGATVSEHPAVALGALAVALPLSWWLASPTVIRWAGARPGPAAAISLAGVLGLLALGVGLQPTFVRLTRTMGHPVPGFSDVVSRTVEVHADRAWQNSGIVVARHQRLTVRPVGGRWAAEPNSAPNNGHGIAFNCRQPFSCTDEYAGATCQACPEAVKPDACWQSLLFRVGERVFAAGDTGSVVAQEDGDVWLRINDADNVLVDNHGTLQVEVMVSSGREIQGRTVEALASQPWQATGLGAEPGDVLSVEVLRGEWTCRAGENPYNGGQGKCWTCSLARPRSECLLPHPDGIHASLVARVGSGAGAVVFGVGRQGALRVSQAGEVYLRMNDGDTELADNAGSLVVRVARESW